MRPRFHLVAGLAGLAVLTATPGSAETIRIAVDRTSFVPAQVTAHVGDTIEWVSTDFLAHTASARNKEWDLTIPPKTTRQVKVEHAGEIDYYCRYHPNMVGRISVMQ